MNAALMNVEHAASTARCAEKTRPSTLTSQSVSDPSRHICAMASLRERAISSLATVSPGAGAGFFMRVWVDVALLWLSEVLASVTL